MPDTPTGQLTPGAIADRLLGLATDRDERAAQLCQEALLTLSLNGYEQIAEPGGFKAPPKRPNFALRSLALGENFLEGRDTGRTVDDETSPQRYGEILSRGENLRGSANLALAREALTGLIDPDTRKGQPGGWLLFPFHESLLWYDARRQPKGWGTRRVWMRGRGITIARLLADSAAGPETRALGTAAIAALRTALQAPSPLGHIAAELEKPVEGCFPTPDLEKAEEDAWEIGGSTDLADLADLVCRHAEGVLNQGAASSPAKLWQLRSVLALDVALNALRRAWQASGTAQDRQYLLLSFGGPPRAQNRVRQHSEGTLNASRIAVQEALLATLAVAIRELADDEDAPDWDAQFVTRRGKLGDQIAALRQPGLTDDDIDRIAREIVDESDYARAVRGFTGLLQTAGLIAGTGSYQYFTATPELLAALVGALSPRMPMTSTDFFDALRTEWGLIVGQDSAAGTALLSEIDGADLERNARRAEAHLADSGLALALSDRTTVVGERARRTK